jgi:hypothetical protein
LVRRGRCLPADVDALLDEGGTVLI